ncbi:uncharacterized protein LOC119724892 [Patiria miniata]|uniref:Uncharacterized protein n=1 Tax=Patiria miniata TaxID=46514 RepID=A0A913ZLZ2_PATMI|nr:uncharacterized protein LOC119724892 [Patiria miniata]
MMNPRQPNPRKTRLPKLPKNVGGVPSRRVRPTLPRDELYPALSKNIIKVNGSLYKYSTGTHEGISPRTVHTEPIVLPSIRRKVQAYLAGDLKDKAHHLGGRYKSESINVATGVAFLEQKPVPLIKSEAPGHREVQSFPRRALPQWASTRSKTKTNPNKIGYRLSPLAKKDNGAALATEKQDFQEDGGRTKALDAFNEAKIEEFRWWHEKMRRISGDDHPRAPPNSALFPEPSTNANGPNHAAMNPVTSSVTPSRRKDKDHTIKKQKTAKSTDFGLTSDGNCNTSGKIHIHQRNSSIVGNSMQRVSSAKVPDSDQPKFKANLIDVHVPTALPDSTPKKSKQRERVTQWLAQCEQAVETSDNKHWFRLPGIDSDDSRCSTCEKEFAHYGGVAMSTKDSTETRPSVDFTKARMSSRDRKFQTSKSSRR